MEATCVCYCQIPYCEGSPRELFGHWFITFHITSQLPRRSGSAETSHTFTEPDRWDKCVVTSLISRVHFGTLIYTAALIHIISLFTLWVFYVANISEHLPTQPWEYTHKDQTTTPGTTSPTLCEQWVGSLTSHRVIYEQGLWDGTYGVSFLSEKTRKSNHLQMSLHITLSPQLFKDPEWWSGRGLNPGTLTGR